MQEDSFNFIEGGEENGSKKETAVSICICYLNGRRDDRQHMPAGFCGKHSEDR